MGNGGKDKKDEKKDEKAAAVKPFVRWKMHSNS